MSLYWPQLSERDVLTLVGDLEEWVGWLRTVDRRIDHLLQPCWPRHPGVVIQLAAWQQWWWSIYAPRTPASGADSAQEEDEVVGGSENGQQAIAWWDSLERAQHRLHQEFQGCKPGACWRARDARSQAITEEAMRQQAETHELVRSMAAARWQGYLPPWSEE